MEVREILIDHDIKPSIQRVEILNYLLGAKNHPSVDTIYTELLPIIPTLSKTTIYNTLKLFAKNNIVNEIVIEGKETRYDAIYTPHGHFKCLKCNKIYDFEYDIDKIKMNSLKDFDIHTIQFYIKGICSRCTGK